MVETDAGEANATPSNMNEKMVDTMTNIAGRTTNGARKDGSDDPAHFRAMVVVLTLVITLPNGALETLRWTYGKWFKGKDEKKPYCLRVVSDKASKAGANFSLLEILGSVPGFAQIGFKSYYKVRGQVLTGEGNQAVQNFCKKVFKASAKIRDIIESNGVRYGTLQYDRVKDGAAARYTAYNKLCESRAGIIPPGMVAFDVLPFDTEMLKNNAPVWCHECETWGDFIEGLDDHKDIGRYALDGGAADDDDTISDFY